MNPNDYYPRVQGIVAEALHVSPETITTELNFGDIPEWDSMGHMEVMMLLEEHFGVDVNADTISNLTSIQSICNHLQQRN